ncbi:hypothetical protein GGR39_003136 [Novosphingobium fluoreni]|uniref:Rad50/SbcC-type AAA domain-containing protein n=1 Tax=Novosphingobium fluoreni TaxID=1391222 RepID=A0A7W6FZF3_9SPHN|nr:AAA family ATPase [Novosphingobium fluoreni]MBB3941459.1 hypothetical protein [Novosphingobium fluoreni]
MEFGGTKLSDSDTDLTGLSPVRALHLLTTDLLLAELVSGRPIATNEGHRLTLESNAARGVLSWYRAAPAKWAGNVMTPDCEAIITSIGANPDQVPAPAVSAYHERRVLRLAKIVAHRFAGLHAYGTADEPSTDFVFEPNSPITIFEGWNGSGKTSLMNSVIWCLTGKLLRPQRLPEAGDAEFDCEIDRGAMEEVSQHKISAVTPLPSVQHWTPAAAAKTVPADTWVELTFELEDGTRLPPIRRTQSRKTNGKLEEVGPNAADLGLDPIAFTLGTTMPGLLPYLQIGNPSELGLAVAKLTGLSDLVALAKHATRARAKIAGDITKERKGELERIEADYRQHRNDLEQRVAEFPEMAPASAHPAITDDPTVFAELSQHFENLKANGLAHARDVLGDTFDASDATQRQSLEQCIAPALEQVRRLSQLPSMERLAALKLEVDARQEVNSLIDRLFEEAGTLEELSANPVLERRTQLYARVTDWMREHGKAHDDHCAICHHSLAEVVDPETGGLVAEHLRQVAQDSEILSKTVSQWAEAWTGKLARDLPDALRRDLQKDLPASPSAILRAALLDDLFSTEGFTGVLSSLRSKMGTLTDHAMGTLPAFAEPTQRVLPSRVGAHAAKLSSTLNRLIRALAFVDWMADYRDELVAALEEVRGKTAGPGGPVGQATGLRAELTRLDAIVKGVAPINAAVDLSKRMTTSQIAHKRKLKAIEDCGTAVEALDEIIPIGGLATAQVEGLQARLHHRAEYWRNAIYQNATTLAPKPHRTGMTPQGAIAIQVGRDGVHAPAQHVSNASALRASLVGFYLAFREHVLRTDGGLSLLILDDPQDLLDYDNRARLARALNKLAEGGAQILATTYDRSFGRILVAEARGSNRVEHRAVHPVHTSRGTLETSLAIEDLDRKRNEFVANADSAPHAQDYANQARIFLEARLGDLFDDPAYPAFSAPTDAPTLMPLVGRLRSLVTARSNELFRSPVLSRFCEDPALADGAAPRRVLNQAHHRDADALSYIDVQNVDADLKRLRSAVERVHEEFRRYRWREPLQETLPDNVVPLTVVTAPAFNVPIVQDIAAFSRHVPSGGNQDDGLEMLSSQWFDDKSLFYIRKDTMGFTIPAGYIAIVEATPSAPADHELVIGRRGTQAFARRLLRPRNGEGYSLAAEATDPRSGRPTLAFENHELDLHRVVGALFVHVPPPDGREEAAFLEGHPALGRVEVAYRVREESAVPLVMPGQIILGGAIMTLDQLDAMEGEMVAVTLEDGDSILKRIGAPLSRSMPYLRQFETIGGLGASVALATERVEGAPDLPVMLNARLVLGVVCAS